MVRNAPPINPDQNVYFAARWHEKSNSRSLSPAAAATCVTSLQPPGIRCSNTKNVAALPVRYSSNYATSVQITAFMPPSNVQSTLTAITINTSTPSEAPRTTHNTCQLSPIRTHSHTPPSTIT